MGRRWAEAGLPGPGIPVTLRSGGGGGPACCPRRKAVYKQIEPAAIVAIPNSSPSSTALSPAITDEDPMQPEAIPLKSKV